MRTCSVGEVRKWFASSRAQTINLINGETALRTGTRRAKNKLLAFSNRELRP